MKKTFFLVFILISIFSCSNNIQIADSSVGNFYLGANYRALSHENREKYAKDGLYFSFENEILTSIFVTNEKYKTKDGLYVGYRFPESELNIDSTRIEKNGISFFIENYEIVGILVAQNDNEVE
jgi:hypothetical protein